MKINIFHIVYGHLLTLRFGDEGKYSKIDILLFFFISDNYWSYFVLF